LTQFANPPLIKTVTCFVVRSSIVEDRTIWVYITSMWICLKTSVIKHEHARSLLNGVTVAVTD